MTHSIANIRFRFEEFLVVVLITVIISLSALFGFFYSGDFKPLYSLSILILGLLVFFGYRFLADNCFSDIKNALRLMVIFLIFLGWASLFLNLPGFNYSMLEKPVFPFSEQSHYALTLGLLVVALVSVSGKVEAIFYIINMVCLSLIFPNLTLLVFCLLSTIVFLARIRILYLIPLFVCFSVFFVFVVVSLVNSNEYFASRLDFSNLTNLTTLVWVQGWFLALLNSANTLGLGLGFNALGLDSTLYPEVTDIIYENTGRYFNLNDGGFLAAKLISEFGMLGLVFSVAYFFWLLNAPFMISSLYSKFYKFESTLYKSMIAKRILATAIVFGFGVEFFLRGVGYFSVTLLLAIAAVIYLVKCDTK